MFLGENVLVIDIAEIIEEAPVTDDVLGTEEKNQLKNETQVAETVDSCLKT